MLTKKDYVASAARSIEVVGVMDTTIPGSRSAIAPLIIWHAFQKHGLEGFRNIVARMLDTAGYAVRRFNEAGIPAWRNRNDQGHGPENHGRSSPDLPGGPRPRPGAGPGHSPPPPGRRGGHSAAGTPGRDPGGPGGERSPRRRTGGQPANGWRPDGSGGPDQPKKGQPASGEDILSPDG